MNQKLQVKITAKFDFASPFQSGQAQVCTDCRMEKASAESEYTLAKGGQWALINQKGKILKKCAQATQAQECN
ncbi:MAG: hypothetical protein ACK5P5_07855 [Pseudobdellovibrionaceae bacterium]